MLLLVLIVGIWSACDDSYHRPLFEKFKFMYKKEYENKEEEEMRYQIFCVNADHAFALNQSYTYTQYGITKFSDLTHDEFKSQYLMTPFSPDEFRAGVEEVEFESDVDVPQEFNWLRHGLVTDVKDQGNCGSCWAFSATANIEGQWAHAGNDLVSLSEQQIVSCDHKDDGCGGGWPWTAYKYVIDVGGIESDDAYPYKSGGGKNLECEFDKEDIVASISNYKLLPKDEDQIQKYSFQHGPISVCLNAESLQNYYGGIFDPSNCDPQSLDHCVMITGWGVGGSMEKFWIVKNSWGVDWGMAGYFWLIKGSDKCGIDQAGSSAEI